MPRELLHIERSLSSIDRSLGRIHKTLEVNAQPAYDQPTTQSGYLKKRVPLEIDWTPATIKVDADFVVRRDGRLTIVIEVEGEDADILAESLDDVPMKRLQLSSYAD